jgi:hypothetical protein
MKEIFPFAASTASSYTWVLVLLLLAVPAVLIYYFTAAPRSVRYEVSPEGLRIRGDLFYSRSVPIDDLILDRALAVDLKNDRDHQLSWRRNGTALPNYKSGWFSLKNGEKALVFIGDSSRVAYIPVRSGYSLLLSVPEPRRLIEAATAATRPK